MDRFPPDLTPSNRSGLLAMQYNHALALLRHDVFETVVSNNADNFYDLSSFKYHTHVNFKAMVAQVRAELENLGWKTKLAYGETALFVFDGVPPSNAW